MASYLIQIMLSFKNDPTICHCWENGLILLTARRQSLDNILGPTGEKVKEIFSQGMMMLNISSLTERRNSEPKTDVTNDKTKNTVKKIPSPLERTLTYLTAEEDNSDTESLSRYCVNQTISVKMLTVYFSVLTCWMMTKSIYWCWTKQLFVNRF